MSISMALLLLAATARATPAPLTACGVRYIRVSLDPSLVASHAVLNFGELMAFAEDGANVALRKPASASSEHAPESYCGGAVNDVASAANDGNPCTFMATGGVGDGFPASVAANPWWEVDLQAPFNLTSLAVYIRNDDSTGTY